MSTPKPIQPLNTWYYFKPLSRRAGKNRFSTHRNPFPSPLLCVVVRHLPEAIKSIRALLARLSLWFWQLRARLLSSKGGPAHAPEQGRGDIHLRYRALTAMLLGHTTTRRGRSVHKKGLAHSRTRCRCNQLLPQNHILHSQSPCQTRQLK